MIVFLFGAFALVVASANVFAATWGLVPVGFELTATAGVWAAGLALVLRDELHARAGARVAYGAILLGALLTALTAGPRWALASSVAFVLSELVDLVIYGHFRGLGGRLASNAVAAPIDTFVFLGLAGLGATGSAVAGQVLVKVVHLAPLAVLCWWLAQRPRRALMLKRQAQGLAGRSVGRG